MKTKRLNLKLLCILLTGMFYITTGAQNTYYVNTTLGNDFNDGISMSTPWKTISKLNSITFLPGDVILFKAGETFPGSLIISSSGNLGNPIVFDSYGTGELPILDGQGADFTVFAENQEYLEFKNLQITNHRDGVITSSDRFHGMLFESDDYGTVNHLHFDNITVFDVNSSSEKSSSFTRYYGGILFYAKGSTTKSNFNDLLVENSTFENIGRTGVNIRSDWWYRNSDTEFGDDLGDGRKDNWYASTNVVFRDNIFRHIRGNGLIVRVTIDALVEGNFFDYCGDEISGNAAFCFNTDGTIFQFNEAQNTIYNEGDTDARGIDSDYRTKNTIIQYNYLHDNGLGGIVVTGGPAVSGSYPERYNIGTIVRYNILENNAQQGIHFSGAVDGCDVYNNVLYADGTHDNVTILNFKKWSVYPNNVNFRNNIFYFENGISRYVWNDGDESSLGATNLSFSNNIFFGPRSENIPISSNPQSMPNVIKDPNYSLMDPLFTDPGSGENGYFLTQGSSAAGFGLNFNQPVADYYGNTIDVNNINAGIYQGILAQPNNQENNSTMRIEIIEDAYTRANGSVANNNYGDASLVEVKDITTTVPRSGMLKFSIPSGLSNVKSAKLKLYASISTVPEELDTFKVYRYSNDWSEETITENNRPNIVNQISSFTIFGTSGEYAWYSIDITDYFISMLSSSSLSLAMQALSQSEGGSASLGRITSKEGAGGTGSGTNAPYIEVEFEDAALAVTDFDPINENKLSVYPNPVTSTFNLEMAFPQSDEVTVSIFDLLGRKVTDFKENVHAGVWKKSLETKDLGLKRGIYIINVSSHFMDDRSSKILVY